MTGSAKPRVLCVDDEPHLLAGLVTTLRRRFEVSTAESGAEGLRALGRDGPFAVLLTDYRMPEMDGAEFLGRAREVAPDTVRLLLTGHATLEAVIAAVNRGKVFRFLLKPCRADVLLEAVDDAVEQSRLVTADRVLLQGKLDEMSRHLLDAERLATLGTLAGAVGHELNNAVAAFDTALHLIEGDVAAGRPPAPGDLDVLRQVLSHLATHGKNLLHLGRPDRTAAESSDICRVAADTVVMLRSAGILRRAQVDLALPQVGIRVPVPRTRVEQVLVNLLKNAVDAIAEVTGRAARLHIGVTLEADGASVSCSVADNGRGIPADELSSIFEPYYTTKPPDRGTGLGLFVVKQIVESAGGRLEVASQVGLGATFTFRLPVAASTRDAARPALATAAAAG